LDKQGSSLMTDSPERRRRAVEALAGSYAIQRMRESGEDFDTAFAACLPGAEDDPEVAEIIALVDAAPPPGDWDPEKRRAVRRLLREPVRHRPNV
jgi:hypothetical protein